jgi:hypothetical protein
MARYVLVGRRLVFGQKSRSESTILAVWDTAPCWRDSADRQSRRVGRVLRRLRRKTKSMLTTLRMKIAAVSCLVGGSIVSTVQYLITPVDGDLKGPELVSEVAEKQTQMAWAAALDIPVVLLWVPAMLFLGYLAGGMKTKLGLIGSALIFLPLLAAVPAIIGLDYLALVASGHDDLAAAGGVLQEWLDNPIYGLSLLVYLAGHVIGFILIGVALFRAKVVPRWAAVMIGVFPFIEVATWNLGKTGVAFSGVFGLVGFVVAAKALVSSNSQPSPPDDYGVRQTAVV